LRQRRNIDQNYALLFLIFDADVVDA
jgi:hypothetical protein